MKTNKRTIIILLLALLLMLLLMFEHSSYAHEVCYKTYPKDIQMQEFCNIIQDDYLAALRIYVIMTDDQDLIKTCMVRTGKVEYDQDRNPNLITDWQLTWLCVELENNESLNSQKSK